MPPPFVRRRLEYTWHPDSARAQAPPVANARGVPVDQVNRLAAQFTEGPELGLLGKPRVNVLKLNIGLHHQFPRR